MKTQKHHKPQIQNMKPHNQKTQNQSPPKSAVKRLGWGEKEKEQKTAESHTGQGVAVGFGDC